MFKKYILIILFVTGNSLVFLSCSKSNNNKSHQTNRQNPIITSEEDSIKFENLTIKEPSNAIHFIIDTVKSKVFWAISKHNGYVKFSSGKIGVLNKKIVNSIFTVNMDSIVDLDIDYQLMKGTLEKILKSVDFFNTKEYPNSIFKIDSTKMIEEDRYFISGYMKIFNIIRPVSFYSNIKIKKDTLFAESERFQIDRTKWGLVSYTKEHIKNEDGFIVPNEINLKISITAYKK